MSDANEPERSAQVSEPTREQRINAAWEQERRWQAHPEERVEATTAETEAQANRRAEARTKAVEEGTDLSDYRELRPSDEPYEVRAIEPARERRPEQIEPPPSIESTRSRLIKLAKDHAVDLAKPDGWKRLALALAAEHDPVLRFRPPVRITSAGKGVGTVGRLMASRMARHMALPEMPEHLTEPGREREREAWDAARRAELGAREKAPAAWTENRRAMAFDRIVDEECRREGITKTQTRDGGELETRDFAALKDRLRKQLTAFEKAYPEYFQSDADRPKLPTPEMAPIEKITVAYDNHIAMMIAAADVVELVSEPRQKN